MRKLVSRCAAVAALLVSAATALAGGSGLNVFVVVNAHSSNSVQLGNYYCEQRLVPPQNLLWLTNWTGGFVEWSRTDFSNSLYNPLRSALVARSLTNQIDYVMLSMDFPYRVYQGGGASGTNGTTSALFYGFKADGPGFDPASCSLPNATSNAYAGSELPFRSLSQFSTNTNTFLVTMITASNLAQAKLIVDRGVASDSSFPTQSVYLAKSVDFLRNCRYKLFDNAIFNTRLRGDYTVQRINTNPFGVSGTLLGYQNGWGAKFFIPPDSFVPGAMMDLLTSFEGLIFEGNTQETALEILQAGATGTYGTVVEPCIYVGNQIYFGKFATPQNYFYQSRGFSLAECYYQSLTNPYQGIIVGEPLAAPFAQPASGGWSNLPSNALLTSTTNLSLAFTAADEGRPIGQVDLFLDGLWLQTLTNLPPRQNNRVYVSINGQTTNYLVPANATIRSVASNLTVVLNTSSFTNLTKVRAYTFGDRIELRSLDLNTPGEQIPVTTSNFIGTASTLTTFVHASQSNFLDTVAYGIREFNVAGTLVVADMLQLSVTKTNGNTVTVAVTNSGAASLMDFVQQLADAVNAEPELQDETGAVAEDVTLRTLGTTDFNVRARAPGWKAAQIQASVTGTFIITPIGSVTLTENLSDLQPRNHLYVTAGATNLAFTFPFNTATRADGHHELIAVAYEGSHVRTQKRVSQSIVISNSPLSATFECSPCASNTAIEATVQFVVQANTNNITNIVLFSTGGAIGSVANQSNAVFFVAGTNLGLGLHPFYAVVTRNDGRQYRTETKWIRFVGADLPFPISLSTPPPELTWPAVVGRNYEVLGANEATNSFQVLATLNSTNSPTQWTDTNAPPDSRFYRVRTSP